MLVLPGSPKVCVPLVHVPPSLKALFDTGAVQAFDLYRLEQNGLAMRVLAEQPQSLIAAVHLKDGRILVAVPESLSAQRNRLLCRVIALVGIAFLGGIMNSMLASAMAVSLAALQLWKRSRIPACAHRELKRRGSKIRPVCANKKSTIADSASTS
ncbi:hypothetical protein [Acidovorax kalamii]|uniref:hypothetical protein n=1 Tax=Acidovorax kalamii TaxID=2004485 RepID=UPI002090406B|nr:hypothetical protein [Acidovorax kalamii]MCO5354513.1 hypothetical protein [Acidovorax kalamii]